MFRYAPAFARRWAAGLFSMSIRPSADEHLRVDHLKGDLKKRSVRGGAIVFVSQGIKFVLQTGSTMVLARLLVPADFGLVAMVTAITGFIALFQDFGLSLATIQREDITSGQVDALFWINSAVGVLLAVLTAAFAPALAWFYHEPRLTWITMALALGFLLGGLSVQHYALLQRQMRFATLAMVDVVSLAVQAGAGILLAWLGTGYWALVWMVLAGTATKLVLVWSLCRWRPSKFQRNEPLRHLLTFGGHAAGFNIVNYFARNADKILLGRYWGAQVLGFYSKAYSLLLLPLSQINAPISAVAMPTLSRLQYDPMRLRAYYLKALSLATFITLPIAVVSIVLSEQIIRLVLGPQWMAAVAIFRLLALSALVQPVMNTAGWLYVATGRTDRMFKWGLFASGLTVLSFLIGLPHGAKGVALCYSIAVLLFVLPGIWYATTGTQISVWDVVRTVAHPLVSAVLAGGACFGVRLAINTMALFPQTVLCCVVMALVYALLMLSPRSKRNFYWSVVLELRSKTSPIPETNQTGNNI